MSTALIPTDQRAKHVARGDVHLAPLHADPVHKTADILPGTRAKRPGSFLLMLSNANPASSTRRRCHGCDSGTGLSSGAHRLFDMARQGEQKGELVLPPPLDAPGAKTLSVVSKLVRRLKLGQSGHCAWRAMTTAAMRIAAASSRSSCKKLRPVPTESAANQSRLRQAKTHTRHDLL